MPGDGNRNVTRAEASSGNEISPSPVGGECGPGGTPASPLQPSPGRAWPATDRGTWLRSLLGPVRETFFFFLPSLLLCIPPTPCSVSRGHSRGSLPHARVHATTCDDQRSWWGALPLGLPNRASGCPFCFTTLSGLLILWAHNSRHPAGPRHFFASDCRHGLLMIATSWVTISFNHKISDREYVTPACLS